ncbi:MAG: hypothetical protein JXA10_07865, partial [Anaerolineae bacterium]|nr:hypothetical protein [Anaerolineae bacterium]
MRIRAIILLATILLAIIALAAVLFLPRPDLPTLPWVEIVGVAGFLLALRFVMATSDHVRRLLYLWLVFMSGAGLILLATNTGWAGTFALLSAPIAGFVLLTYFSEVYNRRAGGVLFLITLLAYIAGLAVFAFYTYALAGLLLYGLALAGITLVASWNLIQHLRGATSRIDTSDTSQLFLSIGLSIALAVGLLIITGSFAQNDNPIIGLLQPFVVIAVGIVALSLLRDRLSVLADNEAPGVFAPLDALHYLILPFLAGWAILTVLQLNLTLLNVYIIQILAMALLALIGDLLRHGMYHPTSEAARDVPVDTRLRDPLILLMWAALIGYAVLRYGQGTCWEMLAALVVCFFPATIMIVILLLRDTLTQPLPEAARRDYTFWGRFRASYRYNDPLERQLAEYADREQPESITEIIAAIPTTISLLRALGWTAVYVFSLYALVQAGTGRSDGAELTGLALALPVLCWWLVQHANLTRRMAYLHEFDETVTILRDQIRLGTSLLLTIEALARQAPPLFRNAFRQVLISVQIGIPLADAMWQCIGNKRIPELSYLSDTILMPQTINANATQNLPPSLTRLKDLHHLRFPATYSLSLLTLLPHLIVLLASLFAIALIPVQLASFALADTFSHLSGWPSGVIGLGVGGIVIGCIQSARYERILVHTALRYRVTALWLTELALYLLGAIGLLALWLSNWTYDGKADVLALAAGVLATTISLRL